MIAARVASLSLIAADCCEGDEEKRSSTGCEQKAATGSHKLVRIDEGVVCVVSLAMGATVSCRGSGTSQTR